MKYTTIKAMIRSKFFIYASFPKNKKEGYVEEQNYYTTEKEINQQILHKYYKNISVVLQSLSNTIGSFII